MRRKEEKSVRGEDSPGGDKGQTRPVCKNMEAAFWWHRDRDQRTTGTKAKFSVQRIPLESGGGDSRLERTDTGDISGTRSLRSSTSNVR